SGLPSLLKSPTARAVGCGPAAKVTGAAKLTVEPPGAVVFRDTQTLPPERRARSGLPSSLKSATATWLGTEPVGMGPCGSKRGVIGAAGSVLLLTVAQRT